MTERKKSLVELAKLAEEVERYEDMAATMKNVAETTPVLSEEERSLLAVAYQKVIERRLKAWRILNSIGQKTDACEERLQMAREYSAKVVSELKSILADVLGLLDHLIAKSASLEDKALYRAMWHSMSGCILEVAGICPVAKIADEDLQTILKQLPPYERLIASQVCVKWHELSAKPWRDVVHLDLSRVPTENIHAVIRKCPKLVSISAQRQNLGDLCRFFSRLNTETSLKCIGCDFTAADVTAHMEACLRNAPLRELIWHSSRVHLQTHYGQNIMPVSFPRTLRRLELVALDGNIHPFFDDDAFELPLLESVMFASLTVREVDEGIETVTDFLETWPGISALTNLHACVNLREAYLDTPFQGRFMTEMVFALAMLEVLFLNNVTFMREDIVRLMTQHRSLRVLVLTASRASEFDGKVVIPVRKRFPNGFHAEPMPQLQLFLGKIASQRLRFTPSETDALKIYPIDTPLPQFLEKEGVKSTFEGSWIASRICDLAKNGERLVDYYFEGNTEEILYTQ